MLESIRSSAQSFGVKIAFGVIILVFVFWGVGNFNDRDYSNVVAMVNGEPIVAQEFEKAYQSAEEYILKNNPGVTREELIKRHLGRQVLRDMIQDVLLRQEARRAGMAVEPIELRKAVGSMPFFQNDKGEFDPEAYKRYLNARRIAAPQYEKELADQLLKDKMIELLSVSEWTAPQEARERYNYLRERRAVDYIFEPASKFAGDVKASDEEIADWNEKNKGRFAVPQMIDAAYVSINPENLADLSSVSKEEAQARYEAVQNRFETPEQANVSHILIPVDESADEAAQKEALKTLEKISKELASGKSFADMANKHNKENAAGPGGNLGWIRRGQTVAPFEEAVFAAVPGKVSQPVRTPFGWHLILVNEKKAAAVKSFEEVENEIKKEIAVEKAADKLQDALDSLIEDNILQKPLEEMAARRGLKVQKTGLLDKENLKSKLGLKDDAASVLFSTPAGVPLDSALEAGDSYLIARVEKNQPESIKPLSEVKDEIRKIIIDEKALAKAMEQAEALLKQASQTPFEQFKKEEAGIKAAPSVGRGELLDKFASGPELNEAIFSTAPGAWLSQPYSAALGNERGAILARVDHLEFPNDAEFEKVKKLLEDSAKQERMSAVYGAALQKLADGAKIEITNSRLIDRGEAAN